MPAREMQEIAKLAGLDPLVVDEIPHVVEECGICNEWSNLPPKQVAKQARAQRFNELLWMALFFATCYCEGTPRDVTSLHMSHEATVLCMLPIIAGQSQEAIRAGFTRRVRCWDFREKN